MTHLISARSAALAATLALLGSLLGVPSVSAATTLKAISSGSTWKYLNEDAPASTGWQSPSFNDAVWSSGASPLGHEDAPRTDIGDPYQAVYLRKAFAITNPTTVQEATLTMRVDDGAVVYLNGAEIGRNNMPTGGVSYWTSASTIDSYDGKRWVAIDVPVSSLRTSNVLAVEVHAASNASWRSGDITFDAELSVTTADAAPTTPSYYEGFSGKTVPTTWENQGGLYGSGSGGVMHCNMERNVTAQDGYLRIMAKKETVNCQGVTRPYTTGYVNSRGGGTMFPLYGRIEFRARIPHGQGLWPGIWLRHANGSDVAEIDLMEGQHASKPGYVTQTLHFPATVGPNAAKLLYKVEDAVEGVGDWHVYAVEIRQAVPGEDSQMRFTMYVDGVRTLEYVHTHALGIAKVDRSRAWDVAFTFFVGGTWLGHPDKQLGYLPDAAGGICAQTWKPPTDGNPANCPTEGIWLAPWGKTALDIDYVRYSS